MLKKALLTSFLFSFGVAQLYAYGLQGPRQPDDLQLYAQERNHIDPLGVLKLEESEYVPLRSEMDAVLVAANTVAIEFSAEPEPEPAPEQKPQAQASVPDVWEKLAHCESTSRWDYNGSSGFDGGLQFLPGTWTAFKPDSYPAYAWQATKAQQVAVAERVLDAQGWNAWPTCARKLGLL